jgi:hypothetical protein
MKTILSTFLTVLSTFILSLSTCSTVHAQSRTDSVLKIINPFEMVFLIGGKQNQMQVQPNGYIRMVPIITNPTADDTSYFGQYFSNTNLQGDPILENMLDINFIWPSTPIPVIPADSFSDRWNRSAMFEDSIYTFYLVGLDGVRLYIDDSLLIDQWKLVATSQLYTLDKLMTKGYHKITVEHFYNGGLATNINDRHHAYIAPTNIGIQPFTGELGMDFKVNTDTGIIVNQLGVFDDKGDGIKIGIRVAIFDKSTKKIIKGLDTTIIGFADEYIGNHRMINITPVLLGKGDYTIVAKGFNNIDLNGNSDRGSQTVVGDFGNGAITYGLTALYGTPSQGFSYPNNPGGSPGNKYNAGTFTFTTGSVKAANPASLFFTYEIKR